MSCETTMVTSNDDQRLSDNVSTKQNKLGQSTNNYSQKVHDLKVVLFKLNVGECFPLPGKVGFSVEYPITAINFGKNLVPGVQKSTERKSKRTSEVVSCCLGCKNGNSCTKKAKSSSRRVKDTTKKRKYVKRKKPERRKEQTTKPNRQSDSLRNAGGTSFSGVHPNQRLDQDTIPIQRPLYSTLFLEGGVLKQTPYTTGSANAVATDQFAVPVGMVNHVAHVRSSPWQHYQPTFASTMPSSPVYQRNIHGLSMPGVFPAQAINHSVISDSDVVRTVSSGSCVSSDASGQSEVPASVCVPGFPENSSQTTVGNANTVHVIFSREKGLGHNLLPMTNSNTGPLGSMQTCPGKASLVTQFIPNTPVPLANTGVANPQQFHFAASGPTVDKALPLVPSNFANVAPQQPHTAAPPVYAPALYPLYLHPAGQHAGNRYIPVAFDNVTGLAVYRLAQSFPLPAQTMSSVPKVGSPFIGNSLANNVPYSSIVPFVYQQQQQTVSQARSRNDPVGSINSAHDQAAASSNTIISPIQNLALQSVSASEGSSHLQQEGTVESQSSIDEACRELSSLLEQLLKRKKLAGDYRFLVDHYKSTFEQEPSNAITVTGIESLKHFLNRTESKFRADAISLEKSCLALKALTDKYQQDILRDSDRYRQVLHKKMNTEENIGVLEEESMGSRKKRSFQKMKSEIKELDAKLKALVHEKFVLQEKWQDYETMEFHKRH